LCQRFEQYSQARFYLLSLFSRKLHRISPAILAPYLVLVAFDVWAVLREKLVGFDEVKYVHFLFGDSGKGIQCVTYAIILKSFSQTYRRKFR
jgi:hypothetical protein